MSSYNTDTISDAKDEFSEQTGNSRPQWDVANYQSVLDKYNFSNSCKNLGQFIDGRAPANNAFEQIASDGHFPRDVRKDAEEHLGTTEELAKEKILDVINDNCKCDIPGKDPRPPGSAPTDVYKGNLEEALDYEYELQATQYAFSSAVAPTLSAELQANTAGLLECATEYNRTAKKLQEAIDQFWIDAKTNLFNDPNVEYRELLSPVVLPAPGQKDRPYPIGSVEYPDDPNFYGDATGGRLAAFAGAGRKPVGFGFPYTTYALKEDTPDPPEGSLRIGPTVYSGQHDWANLDHLYLGVEAHSRLLYPSQLKLIAGDSPFLAGDFGDEAGVFITSGDELKDFPYLYANLIIGLVDTFQSIVNKAPTDEELVAIEQGDPAEDFGGYRGRENPAYHALTVRNHDGLNGIDGVINFQGATSTYQTINKGDPYLMAANSVQYTNAKVGADRQISATRDQIGTDNLAKFVSATRNQLALAMRATSRENASKFDVIDKAILTMAALVYGDSNSKAIGPQSLCIRDRDNANEEELKLANEAFGDALGLLSGYFKDRERDAQIRQAQATMDQRSGEGEVFADNFAEKVLFREQCFLLSFVNTIANYKKSKLDQVDENGIPTAGGLAKRLPYSITGFPTRLNYDGTAPGLYNASLQVQGDAYGFINKLTQNKKTTTLHDIENWHLSSIQPKIRLFKVIYDEEGNETEVELKFNSHFSAEELDYFKNARSRGAGVGLKSFTFTYDGSNPFAAKKSIKANMKIFASTFKELFVRRVGETTQANSETGILEPGDPVNYRYVDLALKTWSEKRSEENKDAYDLILNENADKIKLNFRLKAVVGLSGDLRNVPTGLPQSDYDNQDLKDALKCSFVTLNLTPTVHSFDFDENGRVIFDINYLAYVEDFFDEKAYNIFADPEGTLGVDRTVRELVVKKHARDCEGTDKLTELKADYAILARREKRIALKRLLNTLSNDNKIYYVNVPLTKARSFVSMGPFANYEDYIDYQSDSFIKNETEQAQQSANDVIQALDKYGVENADDDPSLDALKASLMGVNPEKNYVAFFYISDLIDTILINIEKELVIISEKLSEAMANQTYEKDDLTMKLADLKKYKRNLTKFRVILGPVEFAEPRVVEITNEEGVKVKKATMKIDFVNFGDIPISIRYFAEFLADRVFNKDEGHYSITRFLNDLFNNLVDNFLNGQKCFDFDISQKIRVNQNVLTSYSKQHRGGFTKDEITDLLEKKSTRLKDKGQAGNPTRLNLGGVSFDAKGNTGDAEVQKKFHMNGALLNISGDGDNSTYAPLSHEINYFVFFAGRTRPADRMTGNKTKDAEGGIFHYLLGRNKGIVKNIKLQKTQTPGLQEVRFEQEGYDGLEQLRVVYDVEIDTYANVNTFPGTYIYIPPEGFDPSSNYSLEVPPGFKMTNYGIGGYYMIYRSEHNFAMGEASTKIYAKWVAQVESEAKEQAAGRTTGNNTARKCSLPRRPSSEEQ